jgi:hypothetical protein
VANSDGTINSTYNSGDGIHVNNVGHNLFYTRVVGEHILDSLCLRNTPEGNQPPIANAGADQSITLPLDSTTVSGSGTDDGTIVSYLWTKLNNSPAGGNITTPNSAQTKITGLTAGTYQYVLKVTDNGGLSSADTMVIIVSPAIVPPPVTGATKYIRVNIYGGSNPYNNSQWNNWNVGTANATNISSGALRYADGTVSGITGLLSHSETVGDNGVNYQGGMAPAEVLRYMSYSQLSRTLTISGLTAGKKYDIELYASRYSIGNSTIFSINGVADTIYVYNNFTNKALFTNLVPNAQGQIVVGIDKLNNYTHFNGFTITEQGSDYTPPVQSIQRQSVNSDSAFEVYPNPIQSDFMLQVNNPYRGAMKVSLIDETGVIRRQYNLTKDADQFSQRLPASGMLRGNYILNVQMKEWKSSKKVMKF